MNFPQVFVLIIINGFKNFEFNWEFEKETILKIRHFTSLLFLVSSLSFNLVIERQEIFYQD